MLTGLVLAALLIALSVWIGLHRHMTPTPSLPWFVRLGRLVEPAGAIGVALLVLARLERHLALLMFTLGYLVIALLPVNFGWHPAWGFAYTNLTQLAINGGVLLLGGLGFYLVQRRGRYR